MEYHLMLNLDWQRGTNLGYVRVVYWDHEKGLHLAKSSGLYLELRKELSLVFC